jgi:hypothetical protein
MQRQSRFGPRTTAFMTCFVGGGWVVLGLATIFGGHPAYPPGDQRGGPFFWPEIGFATTVAGAITVAWAIRDFRRHRWGSLATTPSPSDDRKQLDREPLLADVIGMIVGVSGIAVGYSPQFNQIQYLPGDNRGEPWFDPLLAIISTVTGLFCFAVASIRLLQALRARRK